MLEELQESVVKILVADYDFTMDDAQECVVESCASDPGLWHENSDIQDLAKHLAAEDDD